MPKPTPEADLIESAYADLVKVSTRLCSIAYKTAGAILLRAPSSSASSIFPPD